MSTRVAALLLAGLAATAPRLAAAELSDLRIALEGRQVKVSFRLDEGFDGEFVERIRSGLPTGILYVFELYKDHKRWFDRKLDESTLGVVAMYNAVTREYLVNYKLDGKLVESRVVRDLDDLREAMTRFEGLPAFSLGEVPRSWRLLVKAQAELGPKTLLSLIPSRVTSNKVESRKFRAPGERR